MPAALYLALLHHPVRNRDEEIVTTSVTNIDVHDIARTAHTYGVRRFFVAHPVLGMRRLTERILWHWNEGHGAAYNPSRGEALQLVQVATDLDQVVAEVERDSGRLPTLVSTSAKQSPDTIPCEHLAQRLDTDDQPHLLLLGTGYGLADEVLARCSLRLAPIEGTGAYNHLSVRSAAAILLDRLRR